MNVDGWVGHGVGGGGGGGGELAKQSIWSALKILHCHRHKDLLILRALYKLWPNLEYSKLSVFSEQ